MHIDLHTHSTFSDGTLSPSGLVARSAAAGILALAVTDHDTVDGIEEALAAGRRHNIPVIPGIEVGCLYNGHSLHILGYSFDYCDSEFNRKLTRLQEGRVDRNRKIVGRLRELGLEITFDEPERLAAGQTGRPHIAAVLVEKGAVPDMERAFKHYLREGAAAYVERFAYQAGETIEMIHQAGGRAVLAHPGIIKASSAALATIVHDLSALGLDGLEVYHPGHGSPRRKKLIALAQKHNLLITGGSDFHNDNRPGAGLADGTNGFKVGEEVSQTVEILLT